MKKTHIHPRDILGQPVFMMDVREHMGLGHVPDKIPGLRYEIPSEYYVMIVTVNGRLTYELIMGNLDFASEDLTEVEAQLVKWILVGG